MGIKKHLNNKWGWLAGGIIVIGLGIWGGITLKQNKGSDSPDSISQKANYETDLPARVVAKVADGLGRVTRIKLTGDSQTMFVTTLDGKLWVLTNKDGRFVRQPTPLYQMNLGWNEGAENGMTGLIVGADYSTNHYIFLTYAKSSNGTTGQNQILRLTVDKEGGDFVATDPKVIFTSNAVAAGAHQIQGGVSLLIEDKPHLLFALGDNYHSADSENLAREAGKIMLIREDGSNPLGGRPYPQYPKIQVVGIRNIYDLALDSTDPAHQWVYWVENGENAHDRVVHAPILDATKQFNGNWHGDDAPLTSLTVNGSKTSEYMVKVWDKTVSPDSVVADDLGRVYIGTFSSANDPTKQILMGEKERDGKWSLTPIVTRRSDASGGNLLGLTMSRCGDFYFGDFADGAVYVLTKSWNKQARD